MPAASVVTTTAVSEPVIPQRPQWATIASAADLDRLARIEEAWDTGLRQARRDGFGRRITAEGALLDPRGALPQAAAPPGPYRCRLIRIGGATIRRSYAVQPSGFCFVGVDGAQPSFTQATGARRPGGYLWADNDGRVVFIGAAAVAREQIPPPYGEDAERDVIGALERVGPHRYRLVMPFPAGGATLEVLELVPDVRPS